MCVYSLLVSSVNLPLLLFLLCGSWSHPADSQRPACHQSQVARRPECSGVPVEAGELPRVTDICPPEGSCQRETDAAVNVPLVSVVGIGVEEGHLLCLRLEHS